MGATMIPKMISQEQLAARAGALTLDKIVQGAFLRGRGYTYEEIARSLDVRNVNALITAIKAAGIPEIGQPGMREIRIMLSHARYADVSAMTRQAGHEMHTGVQEFLEISAKDRTIRDVLLKARR